MIFSRAVWNIVLLAEAVNSLIPQGWSVNRNGRGLSMALGDFEVILQKPLGIILQEREDGLNGGVRVKELIPDGNAARNSQVVSGDVLLKVNDQDVSQYEFDSVMDLLKRDESSHVSLTLGDGLGTLNMPKNVVKLLKTKEDAFLIDSVVRQAVRELRKRKSKLGDVLNVEVIVGAGVSNGGSRAMTRFFAIFSTDGVSTYSCNVSATGVRIKENDGDDERIEIVALSCAKDEGLGQTYDLIQESKD